MKDLVRAIAAVSGETKMILFLQKQVNLQGRSVGILSNKPKSFAPISPLFTKICEYRSQGLHILEFPFKYLGVFN